MRLSRNDLAIIRQYGEREARRWHRAGRYVFEVGERFNTERADMECSVNIACVSNHPDWDDTDLNQTHDWSTMRGELPDGPDGRAIFDFYIYVMERGERGELVCNVQAVCDAAGLLRIDADINKGIWTRDGQDL